MFTGLIEEVASVITAEPTPRGLRLDIRARQVVDDLRIGDSIAIDGVCQTVVAKTRDTFAVEAMAPTLSRTTFGMLRRGARVNLERALALGTRLGGHLVQGHIDGVGTVESVTQSGEHVLVDIALPEYVADVTVLHGSIAVNGVSMTVNDLPAEGVVQIAVIPHTWEHTNFADLEVGGQVNLEGDMIGKFVVEYIKRRGANV